MSLFVLLIVLAIGYWFYTLVSKGTTETDLYQRLLQRCHGDKELVERLIELERKRTPHADRVTLIKYALERLYRDNR